MTRFLTALSILFLTCNLFGSASDAQPKKKRTGSTGGKSVIKCPTPRQLRAGITACPDTGCGSVDPLLNEQKNIVSGDPGSAEDKDFQYLADLPDKVEGYDKIGAPRGALADQGEGKMIRVVAYALVARKGLQGVLQLRTFKGG